MALSSNPFSDENLSNNLDNDTKDGTTELNLQKDIILNQALKKLSELINSAETHDKDIEEVLALVIKLKEVKNNIFNYAIKLKEIFETVANKGNFKVFEKIYSLFSFNDSGIISTIIQQQKNILLHYAIESPTASPEIVKYLLVRGADVNSKFQLKSDGKPIPLFYRAISQKEPNLKIIEMLAIHPKLDANILNRAKDKLSKINDLLLKQQIKKIIALEYLAKFLEINEAAKSRKEKFYFKRRIGWLEDDYEVNYRLIIRDEIDQASNHNNDDNAVCFKQLDYFCIELTNFLIKRDSLDSNNRNNSNSNYLLASWIENAYRACRKYPSEIKNIANKFYALCFSMCYKIHCDHLVESVIANRFSFLAENAFSVSHSNLESGIRELLLKNKIEEKILRNDLLDLTKKLGEKLPSPWQEFLLTALHKDLNLLIAKQTSSYRFEPGFELLYSSKKATAMQILADEIVQLVEKNNCQNSNELYAKLKDLILPVIARFKREAIFYSETVIALQNFVNYLEQRQSNSNSNNSTQFIQRSFSDKDMNDLEGIRSEIRKKLSQSNSNDNNREDEIETEFNSFDSMADELYNFALSYARNNEKRQNCCKRLMSWIKEVYKACLADPQNIKQINQLLYLLSLSLSYEIKCDHAIDSMFAAMGTESNLATAIRLLSKYSKAGVELMMPRKSIEYQKFAIELKENLPGKWQEFLIDAIHFHTYRNIAMSIATSLNIQLSGMAVSINYKDEKANQFFELAKLLAQINEDDVDNTFSKTHLSLIGQIKKIIKAAEDKSTILKSSTALKLEKFLNTYAKPTGESLVDVTNDDNKKKNSNKNFSTFYTSSPIVQSATVGPQQHNPNQLPKL